ncbi:phosphoribosylformylglycinamidine cyclo-ligase [Candidatus Pantoea edessiphila]|uniref:Phosphoribosylformylglycinamidine cyclo-ligase n=1 Tax=Candidatus Pantoea edessiphila TaxID=2044610 RepID=A0A2P5SWH1_9GAMM|nr:phosphoribosylformylglycinamidine cyclo-ligase [Candidatus Pantoea edessiphila]PPI86688.1 phosphoribosylformylglycinamidine cyclo-ligase [Candidatus Pantoea edessiphila]
MINKLSITYQDAGVNIENSSTLIQRIKKIVKKTNMPEIISQIGGFNSLCELPKNYTEPVLVATTDGVGTKLRLANYTKNYENIGIDLVAMCVNDIIVCGAKPLFFLDYYSTSKLDVEIATSVINSIVKGCTISDCALIGGETAEIPGIYTNQDYDMAGFCIGVVEKSKIIDGKKIQENDMLIALSSSGPHSNGYSLIHKILETNQINPLISKLNEKPLIDYLIEPTRIYVKNILKLTEKFDIKGIVHITGGGFVENIPRILPNNTQAVIIDSTWTWPPIFQWIQKQGNIKKREMYHIFNCGVGIIVIANQIEANEIISFMKKINEKSWIIGTIKKSNSKERVIFIK